MYSACLAKTATKIATKYCYETLDRFNKVSNIVYIKSYNWSFFSYSGKYLKWLTTESSTAKC